MSNLLLAARCCNQCLTTPRRIVSGERAAEIIRDCKASGDHFFCHKGTMIGKNIHCRGVHDTLKGSRAYCFARAFGIPIQEVDPDALPTTPDSIATQGQIESAALEEADRGTGGGTPQHSIQQATDAASGAGTHRVQGRP